MKTRRSVVLVLSVLFAVLILGAASAAGQAERMVFTGTDYYAAWISPGTWYCPGSEPTGTFPPCPPGSRALLRGAVLSANFSSPQLGAGDATIQVNHNYSPEYTGPGWGTFTLEFISGPASGSTLEGTWTGRIDMTPSGYVHSVRWIGLFTGGEFDGAIAKATEVETTGSTPDPTGGTAITKGRLLDPEDQ